MGAQPPIPKLMPALLKGAKPPMPNLLPALLPHHHVLEALASTQVGVGPQPPIPKLMPALPPMPTQVGKGAQPPIPNLLPRLAYNMKTYTQLAVVCNWAWAQPQTKKPFRWAQPQAEEEATGRAQPLQSSEVPYNS